MAVLRTVQLGLQRSYIVMVYRWPAHIECCAYWRFNKSLHGLTPSSTLNHYGFLFVVLCNRVCNGVKCYQLPEMICVILGGGSCFVAY